MSCQKIADNLLMAAGREKVTSFQRLDIGGEETSVNGGRRRVPRRALQKKIGLLVAGKYSIAHSYELGEGGMLIDSPTPLIENQKVVITLRLAGLINGVMLGHVVYILEPKAAGDKVKYGIQFDQLDFDVKRNIRNFVASSHSE